MQAQLDQIDTKWFAQTLREKRVSRDYPITNHITLVQDADVIEGTQTSFHCYCLLKDPRNQFRTAALIEMMSNCLVDYCITNKDFKKAREKFEKRSGRSSFSDFAQLDKKAKRLFCNSLKSGEGGELLLYLLAEDAFGLTQVISKMPLKTSQNMYYNGADGVFAKYDEQKQKLALYWGESKLHEKFSDGVSDAMKSLEPYLLGSLNDYNSQKRDLELISDNLDFLDPQLETALLEYLSLDSSYSHNCIWKGICFLGFNSDTYSKLKRDCITSEILDSFKTKLSRWIKTAKTHIDGYKLHQVEIELICLPFPNVADFRKSFLKAIGHNVDQ